MNTKKIDDYDHLKNIKSFDHPNIFVQTII